MAQRDVREARRPIAQCGKRHRHFRFLPRRHRHRFMRVASSSPYACPSTSFTQNSTFSSTCLYKVQQNGCRFLKVNCIIYLKISFTALLIIPYKIYVIISLVIIYFNLTFILDIILLHNIYLKVNKFVSDYSSPFTYHDSPVLLKLIIPKIRVKYETEDEE